MDIISKALRAVGLKNKSRRNGSTFGITNAGKPISIGSLHSDEFQNAFGQITRIADSFAMIEPRHVNAKMEDIKHSPVLSAFFVPNSEMDGFTFRRALCMLYLIRDEYYVRVLHKGTRKDGTIDPSSIIGFELIEAMPVRSGGKVLHYTLPNNGGTISPNEIMVFRSFNPGSYKKGYAAMRSARCWSELNDYIIDYETGFFENGAVPAGQFVISAPDKETYFRMRDAIEERHRGAGNNNGVAYTWRKSTIDGKGVPQIEWVPFHVSNRDLNITELLEANNKMIDRTLGVPAEVMGFLQNSNYASVGTSRQVFTEYCVRPIAMTLYSRFNLELARICGNGAGVFYCEVEVPLTEEEKMKQAQSKKFEVETIRMITLDGYTYASAAEAVRNNDYTLLKRAEKTDTAAEANDAPKDDATTEETNAEAHNSKPAEKSLTANTKTITNVDRYEYEYKIEEIAEQAMMATVTSSIEKLDEAQRGMADGEYGFTPETAEQTASENDTHDNALAASLALVIGGLVIAQGAREIATGLAMLINRGISTSGINGEFVMSMQSKAELESYLRKIATDFNATTQNAVRQIIANGITNNLPYETIRNQLLSEGVPYHRAARLAATEVNRASNRAAMVAMQNIQNELNRQGGTKYIVYKTPRSKTGSPCGLCAVHIGKKVPVGDYYWKVGDEVVGTDGKPYVNDFVNSEVAGFHPNCHCEDVYSIEEVKG